VPKETPDSSSMPDEKGHFGPYGGRFVSETLMCALFELEELYERLSKDPAFIKEFEFVPTTKVQYRYIKVKVKNYGVCPDWHLGNGGDTWLFLDEITVE